MRTQTDSELVRAIRAGSTEAGDVLFERHWPRAWRSAYAILGDRPRADDAAQRAIERAIRSLDGFRTGGSFGAWLNRIAVNQAIDVLRRERRDDPLPDTLVVSGDPYGEILERDALMAAVAQLGEDRRVVVAMRFWLDLSPSEIAEALGIPEGTVASRLARALAELRGLLEVESR